jgi:peptide deformylase
VAVLTIRIVPDPVLFKKARKVAKITPGHKKLAEDMVETMHENSGVGLAANQVGSLEKIAVIQTPDMEDAMVLVNPEIVKHEGEREIEEGCLSVPGWRGIVTRSETVQARYMGLDGKRTKINADDLLAQALEHEIDHLNGIVYTDHLLSHSSEHFYKIPEPTEEEGQEEGSGHDPNSEFEALHRRLHGQTEEGEGEALEPEIVAEPVPAGQNAPISGDQSRFLDEGQ